VLVLHAEMTEIFIGDDFLAALGLDPLCAMKNKMSIGAISPKIEASGALENSDYR